MVDGKLKVNCHWVENDTLTISKVLLFICNSAPQILPHCYRNSPIEASTGSLAIFNIKEKSITG
jgi:hypothetical protein